MYFCIPRLFSSVPPCEICIQKTKIMACNFQIEFPSLATEHIETARKAIVKHGGTLNLKGQKGTFDIPSVIGKIAGSFKIDGALVDFNIEHKPFLLTCHRIEKEIRKYAGMS